MLCEETMETVSKRATRLDDSITIEIVDDDELAAIEAAFLQAPSIPTRSKTYAAALMCAPPLQRGRSLAESANHWLKQCSSVQNRVDNRGGRTGSVSRFFEVRSSARSSIEVSLTSKVEGQSHNSSCCKGSLSMKHCSTSEKTSSVSAQSVSDESNPDVRHVNKETMRITVQAELPQGQVHEQAIVVVPDIEELPGVKDAANTQKEDAPPEPKPRCLSVTDFTAFEWCEKQVEFTKRLGKPKQTEAMKAGSARHAELEVEVLKKVEVEITSKEDSWAMRLINFITGARQMSVEGMTRELPVVGLIGGAWVIGIIDELKMCDRDGMHRPQLIDTKTRNKPTPPSAPQKQNGRMQLMVYKCLWDNIITSGVPFDNFFDHFKLRPQHLLSEDIRVHAAEVFPDAQVQNLQDVARMYSRECVTFPESHSLLLLRYEWQADRSLLGQDEFDIEREWLDLRIGWHLEFWHGLREPAYVPDDETWKCRYCAFAELCPAVQALSLGNEPKKENEVKKQEEHVVASGQTTCCQQPVEHIVASGQSGSHQQPVEHMVASGQTTCCQQPVEHIVASGQSGSHQQPVEHMVASGQTTCCQQPVEHIVASGQSISHQKPVEHIVASGQGTSSQKPVEHIVASRQTTSRRKPVEQIVASRQSTSRRKLVQHTVRTGLLKYFTPQ